MASLMLVGIGAAAVVAVQIPSSSSRSGILLSAVTGSPRGVSPSPPSVQNQNSEDEDCASNESQVSEQQEAPDVDDCGKDQSDAAEHQQGTNQPQGANDQQGDDQQGSAHHRDR
jgi:hypothetical protein